MNGMRPDDREFAPEFTVYSQYLCYQTYDVTSFLRERECHRDAGGGRLV